MSEKVDAHAGQNEKIKEANRLQNPPSSGFAIGSFYKNPTQSEFCNHLIYFMKADDMVKAREAYRNSTLPADVFHKECWKKFTHIDHCKVFTPIYQMERDELSCK
ncbi:MAG: hypothetical protein KGZ39_04010 [Simkania sp.]|nr:hypothetical protein [Simkania sp.]